MTGIPEAKVHSWIEITGVEEFCLKDQLKVHHINRDKLQFACISFQCRVGEEKVEPCNSLQVINANDVHVSDLSLKVQVPNNSQTSHCDFPLGFTVFRSEIRSSAFTSLRNTDPTEQHLLILSTETTRAVTPSFI